MRICKGLIISVILITLVCSSINPNSNVKKSYSISLTESHVSDVQKKYTQITAHRGDNIKNPENTLSAFKAAKKKGADWIEIDVRQTKDKKIVVIHDANLQRTTGVDKNVSETYYKELTNYNAGYYLNRKKEDQIPLLKDVIKFAVKNNINLNIEIKSSGYEKEIIKLINKYNFKENCVVASEKYKVIKKVKKINSDIKTVYVVSNFNKKKFLKYNEADEYSISKKVVSKELVDLLHDNKKKVHVWTINNKKEANKMLNLNVDYIITNDVKLLGKVIDKRNGR